MKSITRSACIVAASIAFLAMGSVPAQAAHQAAMPHAVAAPNPLCDIFPDLWFCR